jgi:hypothetical protein
MDNATSILDGETKVIVVGYDIALTGVRGLAEVQSAFEKRPGLDEQEAVKWISAKRLPAAVRCVNTLPNQ